MGMPKKGLLSHHKPPASYSVSQMMGRTSKNLRIFISSHLISINISWQPLSRWGRASEYLTSGSLGFFQRKKHKWKQNLEGAACPLGMETPSACSITSPRGSEGACRIFGCSRGAARAPPSSHDLKNSFPNWFRCNYCPEVWAAWGGAGRALPALGRENCLSRPALSHPSMGDLACGPCTQWVPAAPWHPAATTSILHVQGGQGTRGSSPRDQVANIGEPTGT